MKWRIAIIGLLLAPLYIEAQPTVTRAWIGQIGSEVRSQQVVDDVGPGMAGAQVEWDFSTVTNDTILSGFVFVPADTTQYYGTFPNSNLCSYTPVVNVYNYLYIDDEKLEDLGVALTGFALVYSDPLTLIEFPFTYGTMSNDSFANTSVIAGITIYGSGNVEMTGDAYGTLHLPGATFNNVLRVRRVETSEDSTDLGSGYVEKILHTDTSYIWLSADHQGPLCQHSKSSETQVGIFTAPDTILLDTMHLGTSTFFSYDPTATSSTVRSFHENAFDLHISPNPFVDELTLTFNLVEPDQMHVEVQSVQGQVLYRKRVNALSGSNTVTITPGTLQPGSYVIILKGASEGTSRKVIKWQ